MIAPAARSLRATNESDRGTEPFERHRAGGGRHVLRVDVVLEDHRNAAQRLFCVAVVVRVAALFTLLVTIEQPAIDVDVRVQMRCRGFAVVRSDA